MPTPEVYRMSSYEFPGMGAVINGNFVEISPFMGGFKAKVRAYHLDPSGQGEQFDTLEAAAEWAVATARTHQGEPNGLAGIESWEITEGCSVTARSLPSGEYESDWHPMRVNCDDYPYLNDQQTFPTTQEALDEARRQAAQWQQSEARQEAELAAIRAALEAANGS